MKRLCIILLTVFPLVLTAQTAKKAFKKLEKNEYSVAKVMFDNMITAKEDVAVAEYGLALIYSSSDYMNTDLFKAFQYINNAQVHSNDIPAEKMEKYIDFFTKEKIASTRKTIDDLLFKYIEIKDELSETKRFVKECSFSDHFTEAEQLLHKQAYKRAVEYDNILAFQEFMKAYPDAKQYQQAQEHIYTLEWNKTVRENSMKAYKSFIERYPKSSQRSVAEDKIREIEYDKVVLLGTSDAFEDFIKKYPKSNQAEKVKKQWEEQLYRQSISMNIIVLHNKFLAQFPNSKHASKIKVLRDSLAYKDARMANTPEAYAKFVMDYPDAKQVTKVMEIQAEFSFSALELKQMKERQRIRTQKLISYEVMLVMENDTSNTRIYEKVVYDQHGNIYDINSYPSSSRHFMTSYRYSEDGMKCNSKIITENSKLTKKVTRAYADNNLAIEELHTCAEDDCIVEEQDQKHLLGYDPKRNLVSREVYFKDSLLYTVSYTYDNKGQLLQEAYSGSNTLEIVKVNRQYDFYGNLIQITKMAAGDKIREVHSFTYDKQGKLINSSGYDAVGKIRRHYYYDDQNRIVKVKVSFPDKPESTYFLMYSYITM